MPNAVVNQQVDFSNCTLPEEGYEEWEINPSLAALIKQNKLTLNVNQFFLVCARHLMRTFPLGRSKGLYRQYAEMIVRKYDCLKDRNSLIPYVSFLFIVILWIYTNVLMIVIKLAFFSNCRKR